MVDEGISNSDLDDILTASNADKMEDLIDSKVVGNGAYEHPRVVPTVGTIIDYKDSFYQELENTVESEEPLGGGPIKRLQGVKQLGLATYIPRTLCSNQTRYMHSLQCACLMDYISQKEDLNRKLAVAAGMSHDIATPPFSDSVGLPLGLDDEENFRYVLDKYDDLVKFLEEHGIKPDRLEGIVKGEDDSVIGQLMNSSGLDADKRAYGKQDSCNIGTRNPGDVSNLSTRTKYQIYNPYESEHIEDPFDYVKIVDEEVVFTDVESVGDFLQLRSQLFDDVYKCDEMLAREMVLGKIVEDMGLSKHELYRMRDWQMKKMVVEYTEGSEWTERKDLFGSDERFDSWKVDADEETVEQHLEELTDETFFTIKDPDGNACIDTSVLVESEIKEYRDVKPERAEKIKQRAETDGSVHVYGMKDNEELEEKVKKVKREFDG